MECLEWTGQGAFQTPFAHFQSVLVEARHGYGWRPGAEWRAISEANGRVFDAGEGQSVMGSYTIFNIAVMHGCGREKAVHATVKASQFLCFSVW